MNHWVFRGMSPNHFHTITLIINNNEQTIITKNNHDKTTNRQITKLITVFCYYTATMRLINKKSKNPNILLFCYLLGITLPYMLLGYIGYITLI
jgi:hypothetical protein